MIFKKFNLAWKTSISIHFRRWLTMTVSQLIKDLFISSDCPLNFSEH